VAEIDCDYPRMMFHASGLAPVIVFNQTEEKALGPEWSRKIQAALPTEQKPPPVPAPEPEPEEPPVPAAAWAHDGSGIAAGARPKRPRGRPPKRQSATLFHG